MTVCDPIWGCDQPCSCPGCEHPECCAWVDIMPWDDIEPGDFVYDQREGGKAIRRTIVEGPPVP